MGGWVGECMCVCACVRARVSVRLHACVIVRVCVIGGSRGAWGARAPPRPFEILSFFESYFLVGVRVLPNWLIDS